MSLRALTATVVVVLAAAGCGGPVSTAAAPTTTPSVTPEQVYLADIDDTPGLHRTGPDSEIIQIGWKICDAIGTPGITRYNLEGGLATSKFGPAVAKVLIDAAEKNLCPEKRYSTAPGVPIPGATPAVPATPVPSGPLTTFSDGTWEVGTDIVAGKYKTSGTSTCYWARLRHNDGSSGDIIDNNIGAGPQTVTVKAGEYFESQRCGTWTKAG